MYFIPLLDKIHPPETLQEEVYQDIRHIVMSFLNGVNGLYIY